MKGITFFHYAENIFGGSDYREEKAHTPDFESLKKGLRAFKKSWSSAIRIDTDSGESYMLEWKSTEFDAGVVTVTLSKAWNDRGEPQKISWQALQKGLKAAEKAAAENDALETAIA